MKSKNIKKILIAIIIIILIIMIFFVANTIRKYAIMKDLLKKSEEFQYKSFHYHTTHTNLSANTVDITIDSYKKGQDSLSVLEYPDKAKVSIFTVGNKKFAFTDSPDLKQLEINELDENTEKDDAFYFYSFENDKEILSKAIKSNITKVNYNEKECYLIKSKNTEMYVDKISGLLVKSTEVYNNNVNDIFRETKFEYNIDIDDSIFVMPDLQDYKLVK